MANIRQTIISTLYNDFQKITTNNGYNNTIESVYKKLVHPDEVKTFPSIYFTFGNAISEFLSEGQDTLLTTLEIQISANVNIPNNDSALNATLTDKTESIIQDVKSLINGYKTNSTAIGDIEGVEQYFISSVEPYYLDDKNTKGGAIIKLVIVFLENEQLEAIDVTASSVPTLTLPTNAGVSTTLYPQFDWTAGSTDVGYHIQISTDSAFSNCFIDQNYILYTSYTPPVNKALTDATTYYWRVRAFNQYGYSNWTTAFSTTTNAGAAITPLDWNEITGSNGWWNSYSTTGVVISSGVSALRDQIGSRNLTQTTSTRRPSLSGAAYGSVSSIYFNPTFASESDILSYNDTGSAFKWGNSTTGSMIIVMMSDGANFGLNSGYFCPIARSNTSFGNEISLYRGVNSGPAGYNLAYPYASGDYAIIPIGLNQPQHIIITHSSSSSILYLNGAKVQQITKAFTTFSTEANSYLVLGGYYEPAVNYASGRYTGHIFEAGFNTTALTQAQVSASYEKFKDRFNL